MENYGNQQSEYDKFYYMYTMLRRKIREASQLYLPDIYYLSFLLFAYSINENFDVKIKYKCANEQCSKINETIIHVGEVRVPRPDKLGFEMEFSDSLKGIIHYPTGEKIERLLWKVQGKARDYKIPMSMALAIISFIDYETNPMSVENLVLGATHQDALKVNEIIKHITSFVPKFEHTCTHCGTINEIEIIEFYMDNLYALLEYNNL